MTHTEAAHGRTVVGRRSPRATTTGRAPRRPVAVSHRVAVLAAARRIAVFAAAHRIAVRAAAALAGLCLAGPVVAEEGTVRLGVLKYGTVNWEAQTIADQGLDDKHGFDLEVVPFAGGDATTVALLSGAVDVITEDFLFASRQRASGTPLVFVPYSSSIGAVMVPCAADYQSLADLAGKTIGVAGGPLDKSWLMLQGLAEGTLGFDLKGETRQVFGAPPLMAEKLRQGELDASLNYWHYNARLAQEGYCELVSAQRAARALGADGELTTLGYVFDEGWAADNPQLATGFVAASREAKALLLSSDAAWEAVRPLMNAEDDDVFEALRARWREGVPQRPVAEEAKDAAAVYAYLAEAGGEKLVGPAPTLQDGTFWSALEDSP